MNVITSRKNEIIVHMKKLGADGAYRRECGEFVCDGEKLLREAVKWSAEIRTVLCTKEANLPELPESARVYCVPDDVLKSVSQQKTPNNVMFSCSMPEHDGTPVKTPAIIVESVQDPGNVGTIIRTADAFDMGDVVLTGACADPFSPKTVRATMGAVFRRRIITAELSELRSIFGDTPIYGAALDGHSRDIREVPLKNSAVAIGSEGRGLSRELLDMCDGCVIIPMSERCESLNAAVAASVIMWEMAR